MMQCGWCGYTHDDYGTGGIEVCFEIMEAFVVQREREKKVMADEIEMLRAYRDVWDGTACREEQDKGNGPCGCCRTCLRAEIATLTEKLPPPKFGPFRAQPEEVFHSFTCPDCGSHYFGTSNMGEPHSEWVVGCHGEDYECNWSGNYDEYVNNSDAAKLSGESADRKPYGSE